jgi:23S rRNA (cytosine1962-C5)-methyltransferase
MASIIVRPRARLFHGHDWVYGPEVQKVSGDPVPGSVVTLKDVRGRPLGSAIYNNRSQIVARRFSRQRQDLDLDFFTRRIAMASAVRDRLKVPADLRRVVWSESDGLPGIVVDRYGSTFVIQTLTLAMDQRKELLVQALKSLFQPQTIIERNDSPVRKNEGLPPDAVGILDGPDPGEITVDAGGVTLTVDPLRGQKTGLYLDQIGNAHRVAKWACGKKVLDCFSNQGLFAIACAKAGAAAVTAVEISGNAAAAIRANASKNNVNVDVREQNAFDFLKTEEQAGRKFDLIILDPPSFTRTREKVSDAYRGYKEIHLRALKMLEPDGLLATFSCSHHLSDEALRQIVVDASVDAKRFVRILGRFEQGPDHPVLPHIPETEYLKGWLLEALPGR